jgi:hypothetical protein
VTATQQRTTAFFVQLELGSIARIGLDPFDILVRNIPGYRMPSQRPADALPVLRIRMKPRRPSSRSLALGWR